MFKINYVYLLLFFVCFSNNAYSGSRADSLRRAFQQSPRFVESLTHEFILGRASDFYDNARSFSDYVLEYAHKMPSVFSNLKRFSKEELEALAIEWLEGLRSYTEFTRLNFSGQLRNYGYKKVLKLADKLKTYSKLQAIDLSNNQLSNAKMEAVLGALGELENLADLNLKGNAVHSDLGIKSIVDMLSKKDKLQKISFGYAHDMQNYKPLISQENLEKLASCLGSLTDLSEIDFENVGLSQHEGVVKSLAKSLKKLSNLKKLSLLEEFTGSQLNALAESFSVLTKLKAFDLSRAKVSVADSQSFIEALPRLCQLEHLWLGELTFAGRAEMMQFYNVVDQMPHVIVHLCDNSEDSARVPLMNELMKLSNKQVEISSCH